MRLHCKIIFTCTIAFLPALFLAGGLEATARLPPQSSQENKSSKIPFLELNQPLASELKGDESDTYKLHLKGKSYARVVVTQQGLDVFLRGLDGQRRILAQNDDPFGRVGPRALELAAEVEGDYLIEVTARKDERGGKYGIEYVESRGLRANDRTRIEANNLIANANTLRRKALAETYREALALYSRALTLHKQANNKFGQAVSLQYIAFVHENNSDYHKALEFYSSALALWRELGDRRGEGYAVNCVAGMNYYLGNLVAALPLMLQAREIYRELGNKEAEGLTYHEIGILYRQEGKIDAALECLQQSLTMLREVGVKEKIGYTLNNLGVTYRDIGDLNRAVDYENEALEVFKAISNKHGIATVLTNLASIDSQRGEMRKALARYLEALPSCVAAGWEVCEARVCWQLASVYSSLGETQRALDYYARSAAIYRQSQRLVELARMLNASGTLYSLLGDQRRAFALHTEALDLSRKTESKSDEATTLSHLAELYEEGGDNEKARNLFQQALTICRAIRNRLGEAANLNRLGRLAHAASKRQEAVALFESALVINVEVGDRYDEALTLNNLGIVYSHSGDSPRALDYFNKALRVFREIENKNGEASLLYRVAAAKRDLAQTSEAERDIKAALEIVETIRGRIANPDLRSSYFATVQEFYDFYIDLLMRGRGPRPSGAAAFQALQISEQARARSLLDLLREARADVRQGVDPNLLSREKELLELINSKAAQQVQAFQDPRKKELARALGEDIARLAADGESLAAAIRQSNPRYAQLLNAAQLELPDVRAALDPQTVLLEYRLGDERSYLWLVSPTAFETYELPGRVEIETKAREFYDALTERNRVIRGETSTQKQVRIQAADAQTKQLAESLGKMLFDPVARLIENKRLVIIGEGALQYLPFGALSSARSGDARFNGPASEVVLSPSIAVLAQLRDQRGRRSAERVVEVFADPVFESDDPRLGAFAKSRRTGRTDEALKQSLRDFDLGAGGGLPRLIASREEAQAIVALAPKGAGSAALDFEANRDRATSPDLDQYRVLHFATHGLLNTSRPELSGIVLSLYDSKGRARDGFLRLNQIYNLRLSSELVVLSACRTALGKDVKGEGLIGLTRGFMYAGARRVIASLWKVDDKATAELMKLFYQNLLQKQMTASRALNEAQMEMQSRPRWQAPYYWAGFTLQGDWR